MRLYQTNRGTETNNPEGISRGVASVLYFRNITLAAVWKMKRRGVSLGGDTVMTQVRADNDGVYQAGQTREGR